jgi:hypothetical protein
LRYLEKKMVERSVASETTQTVFKLPVKVAEAE